MSNQDEYTLPHNSLLKSTLVWQLKEQKPEATGHSTSKITAKLRESSAGNAEGGKEDGGIILRIIWRSNLEVLLRADIMLIRLIAHWLL